MNIENVVSAFIVLCFGGFIAGLGYCLKKILSHDASLAEVRAQIESIKDNCSRHQEWQERHARTLSRIDKNVVKVAAKMGVEIEGGN